MAPWRSGTLERSRTLVTRGGSEAVEGREHEHLEPTAICYARPYDRVVEDGRVWRVEVVMGGQVVLIDEGPVLSPRFATFAGPKDRTLSRDVLPLEERRRTVLRALHELGPLTIRQIRRHVGPYTRATVEALRRAGKVERAGTDRPKRWRPVAMDDGANERPALR